MPSGVIISGLMLLIVTICIVILAAMGIVSWFVFLAAPVGFAIGWVLGGRR